MNRFDITSDLEVHDGADGMKRDRGSERDGDRLHDLRRPAELRECTAQVVDPYVDRWHQREMRRDAIEILAERAAKAVDLAAERFGHQQRRGDPDPRHLVSAEPPRPL